MRESEGDSVILDRVRGQKVIQRQICYIVNLVGRKGLGKGGKYKGFSRESQQVFILVVEGRVNVMRGEEIGLWRDSDRYGVCILLF